MAKSPTELEKAMALLGDMDRTEVDWIREYANSTLDKLASEDTECKFLKLSAELRNQIYPLVAGDYARAALTVPSIGETQEKLQFSLALANKQISAEYLNILGNEAVASARFRDSTVSDHWIKVDVRKVFQGRSKLCLIDGGRSSFEVRFTKKIPVNADVKRLEKIVTQFPRYREMSRIGLVLLDGGKEGGSHFVLSGDERRSYHS